MKGTGDGEPMKNDMGALGTLGGILAGIDRVAGAVQDISPGAIRDPLRAEARTVVLAGLADARCLVARVIDRLLDGSSLCCMTIREALAMMAAMRPLLPQLRYRQAAFIPSGCLRDARAIESDARYVLRKIRRSDDPLFRSAATCWWYDARRVAARLRAGTCISEASKQAGKLRRDAAELADDFADEL